ncbi:hypothetical protein AB0G15_42880 [Streptosporangium sp. NPDC023825]|uniref:hypothetical protein n=1 Tax=Streptosporangium sp. NPDC023825 TaxID=3154909 RepID=UPI003430C37C
MASGLINKGRGLAKTREPDPAAPPEEKQKTASEKAPAKASNSAGEKAGEAASPRARTTGKTKAKVAKRPPRRVGRPRGPDRAKLSIRILAENDARLTAAVEATGQSPQYIVDEALALYFDHIGIPASKSAG